MSTATRKKVQPTEHCDKTKCLNQNTDMPLYIQTRSLCMNNQVDYYIDEMTGPEGHEEQDPWSLVKAGVYMLQFSICG